MQAIFGFGGDDLAKWDEHVRTSFPMAGELATVTNGAISPLR